MKRALCVSLLLILVFVLSPLPAGADGGPMVDPALFARLKEGQQVGVVTLHDTRTASVDLFVSILDQTGESHEVTYFVPLGVQAENFFVRERDIMSFNESLTRRLDEALFVQFRNDRQLMESLFAGALLANGVWLMPIWLPLLFTGCAEGPPPISTFQTASSEVSVFGIDESTDIDALIGTTGLHPSVTETLSHLMGQQIAVVKFNTTPHGATGEPAASGSAPQIYEPGLHLSWTTSLVASESGATYSYPLGTGAAWAHPIELTRVYVVAPEGLDVTVSYPELGADLSGFTGNGRSYKPRIAASPDKPAYGVDTASGFYIHPFPERMNVWRMTYTSSNAAEDILITAKESAGAGFGTSLRQAGPEAAFPIGIAVALVFWMGAWWLLMPRLLGRKGHDKSLWRFSLSYLGWNLLMFLPGAIFYTMYSFGAQALSLLLVGVVFGGAGVLTFTRRHLKNLDVSTTLGIRAFVLVTLVSGGAYLLFVFGYAKITGVL